MEIKLTKEDIDALETAYALMEGYCLDDVAENKNWISQTKRIKKILKTCNDILYPNRSR